MKKQDVDSRNVFLRIVFICSMENVVCFLCCKTRGKVVSIERKAARVVGRVRDCVHRSLTKAMLPLEELNFRVTV